MSIIKERIKINNKDVNLKITLSGRNQISGYQQEIDNITKETKDELTNPIVDNEVRRFSQVSGELTLLNFYFNSSSPPNFTNAGFTNAEIDSASNNLLNSFFIMDFYDSFDPYTQTKIFTIYNTQVLGGEEQDGRSIPFYIIDTYLGIGIDNNSNQFYHWFIPKSYLDAQTGFTATGYIKFSFYNAKIGKVYLFYNKDNQSLSTPEKMYFETLLDLNAMTWDIKKSLLCAKAYEIPRTNIYAEKVNDAVDNFDNQQQDYPNKTTFNPEDGKYD